MHAPLDNDIKMLSDDITIDLQAEDYQLSERGSIFESRSNSNNSDSNSNNVTNNLKFYPYSNNKLTRSEATLNLSLSNTNIPPITSATLQNIREEDYNDDKDVDYYISQWSPFHTSKNSSNINTTVTNNLNTNTLTNINTNSVINTGINITTPSTPITRLKRTVSKSELSPFVKNPDILRKWKYKSSSSRLQRERHLKNKTNLHTSKENESLGSENLYISAIANPNAFNTTGLQSKLSKPNSLYPKKLLIPNTPVKRYPLKENTQLSNISNLQSSSIMEDFDFSNDQSYTSFTNDSTVFTTSPSLKTPKINISSVQESSPIKTLVTSNHSSNMNSPNFNLNKYKKLRKSRDSVIMKNMELTNSLQQFTDDLYGTSNESQIPIQAKESMMDTTDISSNNLSFFEQDKEDQKNRKFEKLQFNYRTDDGLYMENISNIDEDDVLDEDFATPTRGKSMIGAKSKAGTMGNSFHDNNFNLSTSPSHVVKSNSLTNEIMYNPDSHLVERFSNVTVIGEGHFSKVYQVTFAETNKKYAIKSISIDKRNTTKRILQEIKLLAEIRDTTGVDQEGKEYVINFISSWKFESSFYVMTDIYENGNLDQFLQEQIVSKKNRLDDWRIWKIIVELSLALRFIHDSCQIVHLDLKPANIMITFEGNLKLGDFGMATHLPLEDLSFENEGDREYIAPEIISDSIYDFRADIFSLGLMIVEIAANVVLPDNGNAWHKLRSGDLSDAGRLSSTDLHSASLFSASTKFDTNLTDVTNYNTTSTSNTGTSTISNVSNMNNGIGFKNIGKNGNIVEVLNSNIPAWVPKFLLDGESLERTVRWMIEPNYKRRPTADQLLHTEECLYIEMTRLAGALIQEDDFGPRPRFFT